MNTTAKVSDSLSVEKRADGVAVVRLDVPGEAVNTLQPGFAEELSALLSVLNRDLDVKAVLLVSGKPDGFVAGADIKWLRSLERAEEASDASRAGQAALSVLASFRVPVIAAIHGACLGGGLELALACSARVATSHEKTKLGLPEVGLGVLPALGGTQRLPRLIGLQNALDLLLTGKALDGQRALAVGLIDELVPPAILLDAALALARSRAAHGSPRRSRWRLFDEHTLSDLALAKNPLGRALSFRRARKSLLAKTHGNYPAPERILEVVELGLQKGLAQGLEAEACAFGELVVSEQARALIHVFFASTELKKAPKFQEQNDARVVHRLAVLGAGTMGAGIAYVSAAEARLDVRLKDREAGALGKGLLQVRELGERRLSSYRKRVADRDLILSRVTPTVDYAGFDTVDVVIEAAFEDLELKRQLLSEVEAHTHKRAIFASNTSSLPIAQIASGARRPGQVVGMHYFSPVHKMPLLELIVSDLTLPWVTATCLELGRRQGKTVIVVRDGAGFYTSRILGPYLSEASFLLAEGIAIERIDAALVNFGFPVGPLALLDEIGIDVSAKVGHVLHEAFGERMAPPPGVERLLTDERLGRKNQRGYYVYGPSGKADKRVDRSVYALLSVDPGRELSSSEIAERCVLRMVNEALHCFGAGVLGSARDGDIGAIFGLGFPAFRGGPFYYADSLGAAPLTRRLEKYRSMFGARFEPAPVIANMAARGQSFFGENPVAPGQHQG